MALSDKPVIVLIGPQGEGKSFGAVAAIFHYLQGVTSPIRGAIIRDRFTSIKTNTIPSIMEVAGEVTTFHDDGHLMRIPGAEFDLFGVDDLADINRLQGSQYAIVWIEEPAPYFDVGSVGIREEVFDICYSRGARKKGIISKILVTMNPASKKHWTHRKFILNPKPDMEVIRIPYGENPHLPEGQRDRTLEAYKDNPEFLARYVRGEFASIHIGEDVVPEFSELRHVSRNPLKPMPDVLGFRFWDGGQNPTCVFVQISSLGQIQVLQTLRGENIGMKQLVDAYVKPLMATKYFKITEWRDIGDLHLRDPDQSDSSKSAAGIIESEFKTYFEDGEMKWEMGRREALKQVFIATVDGTNPKILISSDDEIMIETLGGGWHYPKSPSGVIGDRPVKDIYSHPGDALSHGLALILNPTGNKDRPRTERYDTVYDPFVEDRPRLYAPEPKLTEWNPFDEERVM